MQTTMRDVTEAVAIIRPYLSAAQLAVMGKACRGEEGDWFRQRLIDLHQEIERMPVTYEQDGKGDKAIAALHYFNAGSDWYILEKDVDGGIQQAFGYAILNGDFENAELGYISIAELVTHEVELDLHFRPCTLAAIKYQLRS
jgi:hypothetical protein